MDPTILLSKVPFHRLFAIEVLRCLIKDFLGEVDVEALSGSHHSTGLLSLRPSGGWSSGMIVGLFTVMLGKTLACQLCIGSTIATNETFMGVFRSFERRLALVIG